MTQWLRKASRGRKSRWRRRIPLFAFVFVIFALVAEAIIPPLMVREFGTALEVSDQTFGQARRLVRELRFLFEHQVAEMRGLVFTGDPRFLESYREARVEEEEASARLEPLVRQFGPTAVMQFEEVREASAQWHELGDSVARGEISPEVYFRQSSEQLERHVSTLLATERLEREIDRVADVYFDDIYATIARQLILSLIFTGLALISAVLVGWFWWRQTTLTRELAEAAGEEHRLRTESELGRAELERVTESRSRLMRGFSHDVKNPLGAAIGYLQLLEEGVMGELTEQQEQGISKARRSIGAAIDLIDDLLALARTESGEIGIERAPTDLRAVARDAAEQFRAQAVAEGLELEVEAPEGLPVIESDATRIRQIVGNLLSNAVKYTDEGRVTLRVDVRSGRHAPGPGKWIAIDVEDTGPGIPEDQQELLFHEFTRLSTGEGKRGAGVGLAISRRIARALGGDITVDSEVGRGSTFTLWLPLRAAESELPMAAD